MCNDIANSISINVFSSFIIFYYLSNQITYFLWVPGEFLQNDAVPLKIQKKDENNGVSIQQTCVSMAANNNFHIFRHHWEKISSTKH